MAITSDTFVDGSLPQLTAAHLNAIKAEIHYAIQGSGLTLDYGDTSQLRKALSTYSTSGDFFKEASGSASSAIRLEPIISSRAHVYNYIDGTKVRFISTHGVDAGATLLLYGLSALPILTAEGAAVPTDHFAIGERVEVTYSQALNSWVLPVKRTTSGLFLGALVCSLIPTITIPVGFLAANGANVSRTTYAALFSVIGTAYGVGDGSTTFTLPNVEGYFPRFYDSTTVRDLDRVSRTSRADGVSGGTVGSTQTDVIIDHTHPVAAAVTVNSGTGAPGVQWAGSGVDSGSPNVTYSTETRPKNIYVYGLISAY
jgi:microcystin-dependent protein